MKQTAEIVRHIISAAFVAGAGYYGVLGGEYTALDLYRIERERTREVMALNDARAELDRLTARVAALEGDAATIEHIARERYGMIRDGELLIRFVPASEREADMP